jgi:hypothetical protein
MITRREPVGTARAIAALTTEFVTGEKSTGTRMVLMVP